MDSDFATAGRIACDEIEAQHVGHTVIRIADVQASPFALWSSYAA